MLSGAHSAWEISDMSDTDHLRGKALYSALMQLKPDGLAETDWAVQSKVNRGFFTNLKASEISPRSDTLRKLLARIGKTEADLYAVAGHTPAVVQQLPRPVATSDSVVTLRMFDLSFAMGPGTNIDDYVEEGTYEFDAHMLSKLTRAPADRLFVARGDGDSMFPTLMNDDMLVIDTTQNVLNMQDRIWACSLYGAGAIKRLRSSQGGKVLVKSDNTAIDDQEVDGSDLHIVGRVIWMGRRI